MQEFVLMLYIAAAFHWKILSNFYDLTFQSDCLRGIISNQNPYYSREQSDND